MNLLLAWAAVCAGLTGATEPGVPPAVTPPPEAFFLRYPERDREAARTFYKKHVDIGGLSVAASGDVADEALLRTHHVVGHMLAGRPDVLEAMAANRTRLVIIGKDQVYTDLPEYRNHPNPAYMNERVRGTGGLAVTSFGEEDLLCLPNDRYDDESIAVHEFCHTIDAALPTIDPGWRERLRGVYRSAVDKGRWEYAYAAGNQAEYWAELCQSYFDCNRVNNWNHNAVATREQLRQYDPEGYELVRTTFRLTGDKDWRYEPLRAQPSVTPPPARFGFDPYYTKLTYAREFPVLGSGMVSDRALLKANDTIRKMFAYRHDVLKALIHDGARLVVLGRGEKLEYLPEVRNLNAEARVKIAGVRYLDYTPELKLMAVPEENVLGTDDDPFAGRCTTIGVMTRGFFAVTGEREVIPGFGRGRDVQQYELRVRRLDKAFGERVKALHERAIRAGRWEGTPAAQNPAEYLTAGVEAYFDAAGAGWPPSDADRPVTTREALKVYDPDLYDLVDETMAYTGHQDWRFRPAGRD